ncbi:hypothetical protein KIH75_02225 [Bifidobacterium sp. 64T4]|uniref:hypothetical protein n=1 Tax=Bifidobacterium pongonis TaxID=2834432 RepID=UPI001C5904A9|nr:hypothetical protein [Bifidobacterium pongonis]MBW3094184.1 hypothetical protein [Bifidobacterium pongonis]
MRVWSVVSEAMRNIGSGVSRAFTMFLVVLVAGTLLGGYEAMNVTGLESEASERIRSDADVKSIVGGDVDGGACDRLADALGGGTSAGAMRAASRIIMQATPGKDVTSYEVTSGMLRLIVSGTDGAKADASGVWISSDVAGDFGLARGSLMRTGAGTVRVAGVFDWPNDGRDTRFAYAVIVPVSSDAGTFNECWVKQWPQSEQSESLLYSTLVVSGSGGGGAGVTQVNRGFDARYNAWASYMNRQTRWMPWIGFAVGVLVGAIAVRRRRLEYAGALHSGQGKGSQLLGIMIETSIWSGSATLCSCVLLAAYCARMGGSDPVGVLLGAARSPLSMFAGSVVAAVAAGAFVRQSQLFRYFKRR